MGVVRKIRLLRRIKRRNRREEKKRQAELHNVRTFAEKIRMYKLAKRIRKNRIESKKSVFSPNKVEKEVFLAKIKRRYRTIKIAKKIKRLNDKNIKEVAKLRKIELKSQNDITFRKQIAKRKRIYVLRQIRKRLLDIVLLRYSFEVDSHGVFDRKTGLNIMLHGVAYFLTAYFITYGLYNVGRAFAGWINDVSMRIYYYDTLPLFDPNLWTPTLVKMIYSFGPLMSFFILILLIMILKHVVSEQGRLRLLLVYMILISAAFSIGEAGVSTFADGGFSYFYAWSWLSNGTKSISFITSLILLVLIGRIEQNAMLFTSTSFIELLPNRAFRAYLRYQYIIPTIISIVIIYLVKFPSMLNFELIELSSIVVILLSAYLTLKDNTNVIATDGKNFTRHYPYLLLILSIALLIAMRILGQNGISFMVKEL